MFYDHLSHIVKNIKYISDNTLCAVVFNEMMGNCNTVVYQTILIFYFYLLHFSEKIRLNISSESSAQHNCSRRHFIFYYFSGKIRLGISRESSALADEMPSLIFSEK